MPSKSDQHPEPVIIGKYPTEFEAALVKNMLAEVGIPSELVGAFTAGFRAETPGMVQVMVPGQFADEAKAMLNEFNEQADKQTDEQSDEEGESIDKENGY